jgi:hypothetical protein
MAPNGGSIAARGAQAVGDCASPAFVGCISGFGSLDVRPRSCALQAQRRIILASPSA